jgi:hypothetical protein
MFYFSVNIAAGCLAGFAGMAVSPMTEKWRPEK